jgi:hypothetical protein
LRNVQTRLSKLGATHWHVPTSLPTVAELEGALQAAEDPVQKKKTRSRNHGGAPPDPPSRPSDLGSFSSKGFRSDQRRGRRGDCGDQPVARTDAISKLALLHYAMRIWKICDADLEDELFAHSEFLRS